MLAATTSHACRPDVDLRRHAFNSTACVWQRLGSFCPRHPDSGGIAGCCHADSQARCLPIEPLPLSDWRLDPSRSRGTAKGWLDDAYVLYKPELGHGFLPRNFGSRVYIDIGANAYVSSIGKWFRTRYPEGRSFRVYAFEPDPRFHRSYRERDVQLLPYAAWVENTTITWAVDTHRAGGGGHIRAGNAQSASTQLADRPLTSHRAIDVAAFLQRTVVEEDFVVVKMDVEGAEYSVVPHLLRTGVARLIDEMFLEVHTEINSCCKPPRDAGRHFADAMLLVAKLRAAGIYAHPWS